jgi:DNA-binding MarR family transcriptional regulator
MELHDADTLYGVFFQVVRFHFIKLHELLEKIGLYPGQPPLLYILGQQNGLSQRELAKYLHVKPATMTVMVTRMEKANLLERRPDDNDQRISRVFLTDEGKDMLTKVQGVIKTMEGECFGNITQEEKLLLRRLLMQMKTNLMKD